MIFYADNSEANGLRDAEIPDILLLGGVAVTDTDDLALRNVIEEAKGKYADKRFAAKWNFRSLQKNYEKLHQETLYNKLLKESQAWRTSIFEAARNINFTAIIACIESHSKNREGIKERKDALTRYVFANALQRYAKHVKDSNPERALVVLDWPDKNDNEPFSLEYDSAFTTGKTMDGYDYTSGALKNIGFIDSALFTTMINSTNLQFADMVMGATRDFILYALGKRKAGFGIEMLKIISHKFCGAPDKILQRGICISSDSTNLKQKVKAAISTLL